MKNIRVQKRLVERLDLTNSLYSGEPLINSILRSRGVLSKDELDLSLKELLHPEQMSGLYEAAEVLKDAILKKAKILIVGDFDVDGATSTVLLLRVLKKFGVNNVDYLVPNRFDFGYGLSPKLVKFAAEKKTPDLIVTVDNGISSIEGVLLAKSLNIKVLITDHHLPPNELPNANAIINKNARDNLHIYERTHVRVWGVVSLARSQCVCAARPIRKAAPSPRPHINWSRTCTSGAGSSLIS